MGGGTVVDEDTQVTDSVDWLDGCTSDRDRTARKLQLPMCRRTPHASPRSVLSALSWSRFEDIQLEILSTQTEISVVRVEKTFYGAHQTNFNEDRPIISAAKCRPMILVTRNITYMRIFAGPRVRRGEAAYTINIIHASKLSPTIHEEIAWV